MHIQFEVSECTALCHEALGTDAVTSPHTKSTPGNRAKVSPPLSCMVQEPHTQPGVSPFYQKVPKQR